MVVGIEGMIGTLGQRELWTWSMEISVVCVCQVACIARKHVFRLERRGPFTKVFLLTSRVLAVRIFINACLNHCGACMHTSFVNVWSGH
jgi:hypothetical protein